MKHFFVFALLIGMTAMQMVNGQTVTITTTPTTICAGATTNLQANASGGTFPTYLWSTGAATQSINPSPAVTTTYTVTVTFMGGATATANSTITVIPTPAQATITAGGPTTFCNGDFVLLTASAGTAWQWYLNGNPISGATAQNYSASATGSYRVLTTVGSCTAPMSNATTVTTIPLPVAHVTSSADSTCFGTTITMTADPVTGATYQWWYSYDLNGTPGTWSIINGATGQTYDADNTGSYGVVVTVLTCSGKNFVQ